MQIGRPALGDEVWESEWAKGAEMPLEEAIAYALEPARGGEPAPDSGK
jgi:hypothetical protein